MVTKTRNGRLLGGLLFLVIVVSSSPSLGAIQKLNFTDPLFPDQWHLHNEGQHGGVAGEDCNIIGAWSAGWTGKRVTVAIVDDGLEHSHQDLKEQYLAANSYDFVDNDTDPAPNPSTDRHGTPCAGIATARNNTACGVGIAYRANVAGIRLGLKTTDRSEANALKYKYHENHIYSNSWGPQDEGIKTERPKDLTLAAIRQGVEKGRNGKGSIYVWAAGNGGKNLDNCNYDGYANLPYTICVGAVDRFGVRSDYSEPCAALIVVAPSSGGRPNYGLPTTAILNATNTTDQTCNRSFGGTSAATPIVAGTVALMLEANPDLSWRDVQYILIQTAQKNDPKDNDWTRNAAGYHINHNYGFGRVDVSNAVEVARHWASVPLQSQIEVLHRLPRTLLDPVERNRNFVSSASESASSTPSPQARVTPSQRTQKAKTMSPVPQPSSLPTKKFEYYPVTDSIIISKNFTVEHVVVTFTVTHPHPTDLEVILTSPQGTQSILAQDHGYQYKTMFNATRSDGKQLDIEASVADFGLQAASAELFAGVGPFPIYEAPSPNNYGCQSFTTPPPIRGWMLVDRGSCSFVEKALNAQKIGAVGLIVVNTNNSLIQMSGSDNSSSSSIRIPAILIPLKYGNVLRNQLRNTSNNYVSPPPVSQRLISQGLLHTIAYKLGDKANYIGWPFMTTRCWGEISVGKWTLTVVDRSFLTNSSGTWDSWKLTIYGVDNEPKSQMLTAIAVLLTCLGVVGFIIIAIMVIKAINNRQTYKQVEMKRLGRTEHQNETLLTTAEQTGTHQNDEDESSSSRLLKLDNQDERNLELSSGQEFEELALDDINVDDVSLGNVDDLTLDHSILLGDDVNSDQNL